MKKTLLLFAILTFVCVQVFGQRVVTGKVTDPDGNPLPYLTVSVKGTTTGTVTDDQGNYSITVPSGYDVLAFSFIGMEPQEVRITGNVLNLVMRPSDYALKDVVVTALGITREKKALGYTVQEVTGTELNKRGNSDIVSSLAAKAAGLQVTSSSSNAGAASYMTIRGAASLTGNNQPLFVIDGMPMSTEPSYRGSTGQSGVYSSSRSIDLNPDDIASITVLKGGAATALYGLQASNGVIVITTKKGPLDQKMKVSIHSSVGIKELGKHIELQNEYGQGLNGGWRSKYNGAWGPKLDTCSYSRDPALWVNPLLDVDGAIVSNNSTYAPSNTGEPVRVYDQFDFFQKGVAYNNNVSIEAGNKNSSYFFSAGNLNEEGIVPNNTFNRLTLRLNADTRLTQKVTTGANIMYAHTKNNLIREGGTSSGIGIGLYRTPATFNNAAGYKLPDGTQRTYTGVNGTYNNPYWTSNEQFFKDLNDRFVGSTFLKADILEWMSFSYNIGIDWYVRRFQDVYNWNSVGNREGYLRERSEFHSLFNSDLILSIHHKLGSDIGFNLNLGQNMFAQEYKYLTAYTDDLSIPGLYHIDNTSKQTAGQGTTNYRTAAVFADLSVDFRSMLYLGATLRNEWSTTMPKDNLSALFPSFSASFIMTELAPLKDNKIISFGKLRASWAKTANIADPYRTSSYYGSGSADDYYTSGISFPFLGVSGYTVGNTVGNPDLKHETQTAFEVGTELRFLQDRLGLDFSYFHNKNIDLLLSVPIAASTGFSSAYMNAASMESKGIELSLYAVPVKIGEFEWEIRSNFTKMKNPVTALAKDVEYVLLNGDTKAQINAAVGYDYATIFGFDWWRDADGNVLINDDPDDSHPDGFPWTNNTKTVALGKVGPDWTVNIYNTLHYRGFTLTALVDIKKGGYVNDGTRFNLNYYGQTVETLDRATPTVFDGVYGHVDGDGNVISSGIQNTTEVIKDQSWYRGENSFTSGGAATQAVEEASWVKLREVTFSYLFNNDILNKIRLQGLELYFTGNNLIVSTPYKGGDPEVSVYGATNGQGFDYFASPGVRSYIFGLKLSF
ncbi:MAG: SusC/RagA family TonB-linked outer membrane protein [Bacteroidales bacterium]|nr:SusC/RagA family TonB-linked outer membrane protein [Bacteroidales bacterium]